MTRKGRARFITGGQSPDPRLRGKWSSRDEKAARKLARKKANDQRKKGNTGESDS